MIISIVYSSGNGHTTKQAQAVADGVKSVPGVQCRSTNLTVDEANWSELEQSAAILFGSPTYNGTISARVKQFFEDATKPAWIGLKWRDKLAAGFTNSGAQHGDKLNSLITMALFAAQHGMLWVGLDLFPGNSSSKGNLSDLNRHGSWLGAMAQSNNDEGPELTPIESDLKTAQYLGRRVTLLAQRMAAK